jgi:hypothetical protein
MKVEHSVVRPGYIKTEQIHGGGAGKQEIHIGFGVGNVSTKTLGRRSRRREEFLQIFKNI